MEFLKNFGFDPILLLAQVVNFLIVLWVLKRFLYKPVLTMLTKRHLAIEEGLKNAAEAEKRLNDALNHQKKILKEAQTEAKKIIEDAKSHSAELIKNAEEGATIAAEKLLQEARNQIDVQTQKAEERLMSNISDLAIGFLQKASEHLFEQKDQEKIMSKAIKQLQYDKKRN
ncbi:MAG: ATP synthase F0 subunit B [Candidatus Levybacteria bacterium RIFCSPHIGHO2_12_FULL_38_12]|nr:MAG: ATP synthase F0 subunit B [Candidatus Levybacteria bacterium RIFCSPHIGHO2_01_FULL_38_12]OGH22427.1 MAG: ATP synthase F0 subunit B [Candidatus Levybacteria bacterium RIFCSPHIGHO2_02_FULL_37_18]OGH23392.1 MAG: ATP synthase F0 subunit B [Candidatus Levybacteria bacterium RIFCSPHIGHO2_12_FULL_38_12]OGH34901.1 MAG: ATP synthase F0 subunit B [Candidatus Levybacteria bacterium RIFCSPLOWO2_01_FULL_37_20]OGH43643.1 MAG: ATP synthase F0 subunit B [Candidatus Levybacteria bacterium RIFCSPLOWO2_02_